MKRLKGGSGFLFKSLHSYMKVLQISANWAQGGPGGVEKDLYNYLINNNCECKIVYGRDGIPSDVPSIKVGSWFSVRKDYVLTHLLDNAGFNSYHETKKLITKIEEYKPDIVQIHNLLGYYINIKVLFDFLRYSNIPIVWTMHDCWAFTGHCINFERVNCNKWEKGCYKCKLKKDYPGSLFIDRSDKNYKKKKEIFTGIRNMTLVTPSRWLAKYVSKSMLKEHPILVLPNGIDTNVFRPIKSQLREEYGIKNKTIVLFVASVWNEMKGIHLIPQILEGLGDSFVGVVIGKKDEKILPKTVISIQRTSNVEELAKWYSIADVFVNPTLGDNLPTVNIEALACGTPVVTNNTGGSPEIAGNNLGRIVLSKTPEETVLKIKECLSQNISPERCRERALQYSQNEAYAKYLSLYRSLLRNGHGDNT